MHKPIQPNDVTKVQYVTLTQRKEAKPGPLTITRSSSIHSIYLILLLIIRERRGIIDLDLMYDTNTF
jgi:hypothetical protein